MPDRTLYDTTVPSQGSRALAHERILRIKQNGAWVNITGDANNITPTPSPVLITRENYGNKGMDGSQKIGDNVVLTFSVEGIRGANGMYVPAQAPIRDLVKRAAKKGADNMIPAQWFDALDDDVPAFEGNFRVEAVEQNTGFADGKGWSFTLTSDGGVKEIVSPIATSVPLIESVTPAGKTVGDVIYVLGYKFTGVTAVTVKAVAAKFSLLADGTLAVVLPAGTAGASPIIVTTPGGASVAFPYVAA